MAESEGFKHISVTAADDEDVVIMAGAGEATAPAPTQPEGEAPAKEAVAPEPAGEPVSDAAVQPKAEPEPKLEPEPKPKPKPKAKPKDDYHETTLEDLQGQSMPLAQRIVIIAAIICIIGAVIYYFAFMR